MGQEPACSQKDFIQLELKPAKESEENYESFLRCCSICIDNDLELFSFGCFVRYAHEHAKPHLNAKRTLPSFWVSRQNAALANTCSDLMTTQMLQAISPLDHLKSISGTQNTTSLSPVANILYFGLNAITAESPL